MPRWRPPGGSYCWSTRLSGNRFSVLCADTFRSPTTDEALPARGKRMVRIDLGAPADALSASLPGKRFRAPWRLEPTGRYWMVRLPRTLEPTSVLSLGATFSQGGVPYGVTLKRAKR